MVRQAERKQKQAVDKYNREVRAHNQKVRAQQQKQKRAVDDYNRAARAHNTKVRTFRRRLVDELRKLQSSSSTRTRRVSVSAESLHTAFSRVEARQQSGAGYPEDLYALFEDETSNSLRAANAIDRADAADDDEAAGLQSTTLAGELRHFSPDLERRWEGALFALNPRNPDAGRHFCTSARECILTALDLAAPDDVVKRDLSSCAYANDGRLTRRSKLKYLLVRKGLVDDVVEDFVNEDVDDVLRLFRVFNDGTHGQSGRFEMHELVAVKVRAEAGIRFLHRLVN